MGDFRPHLLVGGREGRGGKGAYAHVSVLPNIYSVP